MLLVKKMELDSDEYHYILPDYLPDTNRTQIWTDYNETAQDGKDEEAKEAMEKAFVVIWPQLFLAPGPKNL